MRLPGAQAGLIGVLAGVFTLGCRSSEVQHSYSDDPLLLNRKFVVGKVQPSRPGLLAESEPTPPPFPATALVLAPSQQENPETPSETPEPANFARLQARTMSAARAPVPALTTPRSSTSLKTPDLSVPGGHGGFAHAQAPDYSWLQGVLDRHSLGGWSLHYSTTGENDRWGGRVVLEKDARLANFQEGDVVWVQGAIVKPAHPRARAAGGRYPLYRIQEIELVERGK